MDLDLTLRIECPTTPTDSSSSVDKVNHEKWERSNRMSRMIIKCGILEAFKGAIIDAK